MFTLSPITRLLTRKTALGQTLLTTDPAGGELEEGEIMLRLNRFGLSTNNITYAAFGNAMNYWGFFPIENTDYGHMPVWGFADVIASRAPNIAQGERIYGYFPIASEMRMRPHRTTARGFYDSAPHRQSLTSAYNQYTRCAADPLYEADLENYQALYRPLFITAFMLADFLQDNGFFGAEQLVIASASSKTAYTTALCLEGIGNTLPLHALTSAPNLDFVKNLGCYTSSHTYEDLAQIPQKPTLYVDFSGSTKLRAQIHAYFGDHLIYDCFAGSTANLNFITEAPLTGPAPKLFFAPVQIKKRNSDWGPEGYNTQVNSAQKNFIAKVAKDPARYVHITEEAGFEPAQTRIKEIAGNQINPHLGHIIHL